MPYTQILVPKIRSMEINPMTIFHGKFGDRVRSQDNSREEKRCIGHFIAEKCLGGSLFISDGSSSFYVGLAMIQIDSDKFTFDLITNNLGVLAELQANQDKDKKWSVEIIGGHLDDDLYATFPSENEAAAAQRIQEAKIAIVSVRELFYTQGPTSPELHSSKLKAHAFRSNGDIIIPLNWDKLAEVEPHWGTTVFANQGQWNEVLKKAGRKIIIVCEKPTGESDKNSREVGRNVNTKLVNDHSAEWKEKWAKISQYERYCWSVFQFASNENVDFIELDLI